MDKHDVCAVHRVIRDRKITFGGWKQCILSALSRVGRSNITGGRGGTPGFILIFGPGAITRPPDQPVSPPPLFESS